MISSNTFSILGGGFGIYGYAAAFCELEFCKKIITLEKYRPQIEKHINESYFNKFEFVSHPDNLLKDFTILNLALPPFEQEKYLNHNDILNGEHLFLEKPLATSPEKSLELCQRLINNKVNFSIGYLFIFTKWFQILKSNLNDSQVSSIKIKWTFKAHHYSNDLKNWKRYHEQGGGVLRFYGIHLVAVLSLLKFSNILEDDLSMDIVDCDEIPRLSLSFMNDKNQTIHLLVDSDCEETIFEIVDIDNNIIFSAPSPFHEKVSDNATDFRVEYLKKYIMDRYNQVSDIKPEDHIEICKQWMKIESFIAH